ncbi:uncharacterized protein TNCV_3489951 [Trichonephila clavipes]|nr:uncharacterized protein TNCV_3489951 [Trichonephila clavipes]
MFDSSSYVTPTPLAHADTSRNVLPRGGTSQWHPTRFNLYDPEMRNARGFNVWPEVYFSVSENVTEFLKGIDNQIKLLEIPSDSSRAYLKGRLMGRALDWYQIFGSTRSNQNNHQGNQWFESRNRFQNDDRRFNDRGYQFRNRGQNDDFSRGDQRNRGSSENFSRGSRKQMGRLNVLKVNDIKSDQTQSINQSPIKLSAICMSPVELPYVPILLDETFTKALWDTGAEK